MKKVLGIFMVTVFLFTTGCSALDAVNDTVNYVNDATDYVGEASKFADEVPKLVDQAVNDLNAREELKTSLQDMKQEIEQFSELDPPKVAEGLHQQIEQESLKVQVAIDGLLQNIKNGTINPKFLENTHLLETINQMKSILNDIESLGK
jgi:hypothetical protein